MTMSLHEAWEDAIEVIRKIAYYFSHDEEIDFLVSISYDEPLWGVSFIIKDGKTGKILRTFSSRSTVLRDLVKELDSWFFETCGRSLDDMSEEYNEYLEQIRGD